MQWLGTVQKFAEQRFFKGLGKSYQLNALLLADAVGVESEPRGRPGEFGHVGLGRADLPPLFCEGGFTDIGIAKPIDDLIYEPS